MDDQPKLLELSTVPLPFCQTLLLLIALYGANGPFTNMHASWACLLPRTVHWECVTGLSVS